MACGEMHEAASASLAAADALLGEASSSCGAERRAHYIACDSSASSFDDTESALRRVHAESSRARDSCDSAFPRTASCCAPGRRHAYRAPPSDSASSADGHFSLAARIDVRV